MPLQYDPAAIFVKTFFRSTRPGPMQKRTILVENRDDSPVRCVFRPLEDWIAIHTRTKDPILEIAAGEREEFEVVFEETSDFFPQDDGAVETVIQVTVETQEGRTWVDEIPVLFEEIKKPPVYQGVFSLDFGTTNSSCAVIHPGQLSVKGIELEPDSDSISSVVYFQEVDSFGEPDYYIGRNAQIFIANPGTPTDSYLYSVKRLLGTDAKHTLQNRGAGPHFKTFTYNEICRYVIQKLIHMAEDRLGAQITRVVVTHPAMFSLPRVTALRNIFVKELGFETDKVRLDIDEASAAALWFLDRKISNGGGEGNIDQFIAGYADPFTILAYDFGGGTIDISLLRVEAKDRGEANRPRYEIDVEILGCTGDPCFGGDNITLEVFKVLKWRLAAFIAGLDSDSVATESLPDHAKLEIERARGDIKERGAEIDEAIRNASNLSEDLERDVNVLVPTRSKGLQGKEKEFARGLFFELWAKAEEIKLELSEKAALGSEEDDLGIQMIERLHTVDLEPCQAQLIGEVKITMEELERRILTPIKQTAEKANGLLKRIAGELERTPGLVRHVILAGKSSNLPIVRNLIREALGIDDEQIEFDSENAKSSVCMGACLAERLSTGPAIYRFRVNTLVKRIPYDIGYREAGTPGLRLLFTLGDKLPANCKFDLQADRLELFAQSGTAEKALYLGQFDFRDAPAPRGTFEAERELMETGVVPDVAREQRETSGLGRLWRRQRGSMTSEARPLPDEPRATPKGKINIVVNEQREIYAEKGADRWPLKQPVARSEVAGFNVFSGEF